MKKGWERKKVSEIAKHSLGKMLDKAKNKGEPKPYLRNLNVRWFDFDLSDVLEMRFLPEEAARYTAVKGDVLICEGGYPGRAAIWEQDEPIYFQKALHRVRFHEPERSKWFLYHLLSKDLDGTLKSHFNGAGIQHFTGEALAQFEVPLPSLPEQHRIVGILDEAFEGIATAKANAEKNLQNARALFESHLQSVFTQRGDGRIEKTLDDVCQQITDGKHGDCKNEMNSGFWFLSAKDVKAGTLNYDKARQITRADFEETHRRTNLEPGDILITNSGTIGRMAIAPADERTTRTTFQKSVAILKPLKSAIDSSYMYFCLSSGLTRFVNLSAGAAQKNLLLRDLRSYRFAMPKSLDHQRSVAGKLDSLTEETQRLESVYQRKLAALEELKKSFLHQAFSGQL